MKNATSVSIRQRLVRAGLPVLFTLLVCAASVAQAQVSTLEILKRILAVVALEEGSENQILYLKLDNLERNTSATTTYTLKGGSKYKVLAIGDDDRITDIDLRITGANGILMGEDNDDENVAIVDFRLRTTQQLTFKVTPHRMKLGMKDGFYGLVITRVD